MFTVSTSTSKAVKNQMLLLLSLCEISFSHMALFKASYFSVPSVSKSYGLEGVRHGRLKDFTSQANFKKSEVDSTSCAVEEMILDQPAAAVESPR